MQGGNKTNKERQNGRARQRRETEMGCREYGSKKEKTNWIERKTSCV